MDRVYWEVEELYKELGLDYNIISRLIRKGIFLPKGWEEMNDERRMKVMASRERVLIFSSELKMVIRDAMENYMEYSATRKELESIREILFDLKSDTERLKGLFDLSMTPMNLAEIAQALSPTGYKKQTLYNYITKTGDGRGILNVPRKRPVFSLPLFKQKREWYAERMEFFRQKNRMSYDDRLRVEHYLGVRKKKKAIKLNEVEI